MMDRLQKMSEKNSKKQSFQFDGRKKKYYDIK